MGCQLFILATTFPVNNEAAMLCHVGTTPAEVFGPLLNVGKDDCARILSSRHEKFAEACMKTIYP
jgi:hypothetical protein